MKIGKRFSGRALVRALGNGLTEEQARDILALLRKDKIRNGEGDLVLKMDRASFIDKHSLPLHLMDRSGYLLQLVDRVIGTYGVEYIPHKGCEFRATEYCNSGDSYSTTITYDQLNGWYRVECYADAVERLDRRMERFERSFR